MKNTRILYIGECEKKENPVTTQDSPPTHDSQMGCVMKNGPVRLLVIRGL